MKHIDAIFLTSDVNDWLENSRHPRILHVFDRTCNLINEYREVLSIVTPQIGNGPFNLMIPRLPKSFQKLPDGNVSQQTSEVFFHYLNAESPVSIHEDQLMIGDWTINTNNAKLWSPCPDWKILHAKRIEIINQITSLPMTRYQPSLPAHLLSTFSTSIATADLQSSITAAKQLAGLGAGLTPAGDDFILGAVYATWIIHPPEIARVLAEEITTVAMLLTTSLSAAWLRSAGRGEMGILWHQFFDALISTGKLAIHESMDKILAVGETSGADAMSGFMGTFMCWAELASSKIS